MKRTFLILVAVIGLGFSANAQLKGNLLNVQDISGNWTVRNTQGSIISYGKAEGINGDNSIMNVQDISGNWTVRNTQGSIIAYGRSN